ncbi:MAG: HNH endonuclease [Polaribacter sp.]|uniref:HNH endonuclease n=1 Tax=Polaribacter sp. TaxID=1920175 RepID=UPI003EF6C23B
METIIILGFCLLVFIYIVKLFGKEEIKPEKKLKTNRFERDQQKVDEFKNEDKSRDLNLKDADLEVNKYLSEKESSKKFYSESISWKLKSIEELNSFASIEDVLILNRTEEINYTDLLNCYQWRAKRFEILFRDKYTCKTCNRVSKSNAVHHKYYVVQKFPWEYTNDAFDTLCHSCHKTLHKNTTIPIYRLENSKYYETTKEIERCSRCYGAGYFSEYSHVEGGVCFKCRGNNMNYSTFFMRIELFYKYSQTYNDDIERGKYVSLINRLSYDQIITNVPFLSEYSNQNLSFTNHKSVIDRKMDYDDDYDDDLPF